MRIIKWSAAVLLSCVVFILFCFETSKVTLTPAGSYKALYPLFGIGIKGNLFLSTLADELNDQEYPMTGPVISENEKATKVRWFCQDKAQALQLEHSVSSINIDCAGRHYKYQWQVPSSAPEPFQYAMPESLLVLTDIHGDIEYLDSALQQVGVTNSLHQWQWGKNQLVILGDSIDRGPADRQVLWRLYQLYQQAKEAGGALHFVLGNHEQYGLDGNHFLFHPDHRAKLATLIPPKQAYSEATLIGEWLRTRPVMIKIADILFVHGGLSDLHLHQDRSIEDINNAALAYYRGGAVSEQMLALIKGPLAVTQFRGQIRKQKSHTPTPEQLRLILQKYGANTLVVGHSSVPNLIPFEGGIVWPAHAEPGAGEVLWIQGGEIGVKKLALNSYNYDKKQQVERNFTFFKARDRQALWQMLMTPFQ